MNELERKKKAATLESAVGSIQRWRIYLAYAGIGAVIVALKMVSTVQKTEPPSTEENLAWLLFLFGICACVPLLKSSFAVLRSTLKDVGGA